MKIVKEDVNNINDKATPVYDANLVLDAEIANDRAKQVKNIVDPYEREKAKPFIGAEKQPLPKEEEPKITKEKEAKPFTEAVDEANSKEITIQVDASGDPDNEEDVDDINSWAAKYNVKAKLTNNHYNNLYLTGTPENLVKIMCNEEDGYLDEGENLENCRSMIEDYWSELLPTFDDMYSDVSIGDNINTVEESSNEGVNANKVIEVLTQFCEEYNEENGLEANDRGACEVRTDYSGRFMYGRNCPGVVGPRAAQTDLIIFLAEHGLKKVAKEMARDNMGLDMIYYFPNITTQPIIKEEVVDEIDRPATVEEKDFWDQLNELD